MLLFTPYFFASYTYSDFFFSIFSFQKYPSSSSPHYPSIHTPFPKGLNAQTRKRDCERGSQQWQRHETKADCSHNIGWQRREGGGHPDGIAGWVHATDLVRSKVAHMAVMTRGDNTIGRATWWSLLCVQDDVSGMTVVCGECCNDWGILCCGFVLEF